MDRKRKVKAPGQDGGSVSGNRYVETRKKSYF